MVSVCAAVALSTSIIPVIPVSADTGMTRYEAERQYTGGWADVVQNSIASGGYVVETHRRKKHRYRYGCI